MSYLIAITYFIRYLLGPDAIYIIVSYTEHPRARLEALLLSD